MSCKSLTEIIIPNNVTEIHVGAFLDCTAFKSINIPNSVAVVGCEAFSGWGKDQTIYVNKKQSKKWDKKWDKDCNAKIIYR